MTQDLSSVRDGSLEFAELLRGFFPTVRTSLSLGVCQQQEAPHHPWQRRCEWMSGFEERKYLTPGLTVLQSCHKWCFGLEDRFCENYITASFKWYLDRKNKSRMWFQWTAKLYYSLLIPQKLKWLAAASSSCSSSCRRYRVHDHNHPGEQCATRSHLDNNSQTGVPLWTTALQIVTTYMVMPTEHIRLHNSAVTRVKLVLFYISFSVKD